jgi:Protein of unknown function (DUF2637)
MTDQTTEQAAPFWRPTQESARNMLLFVGVIVGIIGAIALALSFYSIDVAARPYFGSTSWAIPVLIDVTLGALTFFSIVAEINKLCVPLARYAARTLIALTVYANVAPQRTLYGRILHGAPPVVWVVVVGIAEHLVQRLVRLTDPREIEPMRRSLWLLRPVATWRIWRQMRIHQITTYAAALDRDAARAAVTGRLRLHHGRMWRHKAPLAERIALRLQGRDPAGVAVILTAHSDTAALLAAPADAARKYPEAPPQPTVDSPLRALDPIVYPANERPVSEPFPSFNAQTNPLDPTVKALQSARVPATPENGEANTANERDRAVRMRRGGASFQQIADALGRSKSWAYDVASNVPIEHANGNSAA